MPVQTLVADKGTQLVYVPLEIGTAHKIEDKGVWACAYTKGRFFCVPFKAVADDLCTPAGTPSSSQKYEL